jgi:antitoxin HicB
MAKISNPNVGSSFDDFLKDEGVFEEVTAQSIKRVLSWQLQQAMTAKGMTKREMASLMDTSRSQLDRILDPDNVKLQLDTLYKAASVLGREVRVELL